MFEFKPLAPEDIEVRVAQCSEKGAQLLLYKTARCDMNILDETVGQENWDCSYEAIDGKLFCTVGICCELVSGRYEWVYKQDVGVESNMEPAKGEASDAFKRACFKWGIGRELYTAPFIWVDKGMLQRHKMNDKTGRWACYDRFEVTMVKVENGKIADLAIANEFGLEVFKMRSKAGSTPKMGNVPSKTKTTPEKPRDRFGNLRKLKERAVSMGIKAEGIDSWCEATFKKDKKDYTDAEIKRTEKYIEQLIKDKGSLL